MHSLFQKLRSAQFQPPAEKPFPATTKVMNEFYAGKISRDEAIKRLWDIFLHGDPSGLSGKDAVLHSLGELKFNQEDVDRLPQDLSIALREKMIEDQQGGESVNGNGKQNGQYKTASIHPLFILLRRSQFQPPASKEKAVENLEQAKTLNVSTEISRLIEKYNLVLKLASRDIKRWQQFAQDSKANVFIEDVSKWSAKEWEEATKRMDEIVDSLDTIVIG